VGALLKLDGTGQPFMVVGVVGNVRQVDLESSSRPIIYRPQLQSPWRYLRVLARASGNPEALAPAIRREIWSLDAALPINQVRTLEQVVSDFLLPQRSLAESLGVLSAGALILAAVGIYGLMAFFVSQRVREIGIRLALGAQRSDVLRLVVGRTLKLTALGLAIGLAGAFGLTRLMSNFFFGVAAGDPSSFALTALFLTATALLAGYIPARRASRIDPMLTLRCE
ncbi:MAG: FtsX-like permease family protein, partial [Acidobacteriota bacterium]